MSKKLSEIVSKLKEIRASYTDKPLTPLVGEDGKFRVADLCAPCETDDSENNSLCIEESPIDFRFSDFNLSDEDGNDYTPVEMANAILERAVFIRERMNELEHWIPFLDMIPDGSAE